MKTKSNSVITQAFDAAANALTFRVIGVAEPLTLRLSAISDAVRHRAVRHGLGQRVADKAAIGRNPLNGASATPMEKWEAMRTLVEHYNSGTEDWSPAREAGVAGLDAILVAAVMEATERDEAAVRAMVEAGATKHNVTQRAYLARLGTSPKVAPIADRMRAAQTPEIDADAELEELMEG